MGSSIAQSTFSFRPGTRYGAERRNGYKNSNETWGKYDVGNPLGWIQANIEVALQHPQFGPIVREYCKKLLPE